MTIKIKYKLNITCPDIPHDEMVEMFSDGRTASPFAEKILTKVIDFSKTGETRGYDGYLNGWKCEIKSLTESGLKTCPSYMIGKDRHYVKEEHLDMIKQNKYYIINDIISYPGWFVYYIVPSTEKLLFQQMSHKKASQFLENMVDKTVEYDGTKINIDF